MSTRPKNSITSLLNVGSAAFAVRMILATSAGCKQSGKHSSVITVKANTPDWWGEFEPTKIPLTEDRYVASVEIREVNNFAKDAAGRDTVGQRYVWHHLIWATAEFNNTPS